VEFGPRNASIHKIDECVAVKELEQLVDIYCDVLKKLLG
jgi:succinyl-diaminopimelate desuccinylase